MRKERFSPRAMLPKLVVMAIALVIGLEFGPKLPVPHRAEALVSTIQQVIATDTLRVGDRRLEPRVAPAPVLGRLPAVQPVFVGDRLAVADLREQAWARAPEKRSDDRRFGIVKHVPRMERGDPPRT